MNPMAHDEDFWIERREPTTSKQSPEQDAADAAHVVGRLSSMIERNTTVHQQLQLTRDVMNVAPADARADLTDDVEYFGRKLLASLGVPVEYLRDAQQGEYQA